MINSFRVLRFLRVIRSFSGPLLTPVHLGLPLFFDIEVCHGVSGHAFVDLVGVKLLEEIVIVLLTVTLNGLMSDRH